MPQSRYKILIHVLLMLSVIDFALTAPVVSQDHEVRVSVANTVKHGPHTNNPLSGLGLRGFLGPSPSSESTSTPTHNTPADVSPSPQIEPPPDRSSSPSFTSWLQADPHSGSEGSWSLGSSFESLSGQSDSWGEPNPDLYQPSNPQNLLSTAESRPPSQGQEQMDRPPPPPSEPGPSTKPQLPPAEDDVKDAAGILMAMSRHGFRPRTYGSGAVDAAKGELVGNRH